MLGKLSAALIWHKNVDCNNASLLILVLEDVKTDDKALDLIVLEPQSMRTKEMPSVPFTMKIGRLLAVTGHSSFPFFSSLPHLEAGHPESRTDQLFFFRAE